MHLYGSRQGLGQMCQGQGRGLGSAGGAEKGALACGF